MGGRGWRQSHGVPAGVVPPSGDSYFTICLTESTQTHPNVSHPSPDACARSHTGASEMDDRWLIAPPPSPHRPPRPHTDSPRHLRQLPPSQRKDSGPTSGHNQQLRRSVRHRPTPQPQLHLGKHCRAATEHAAARLYTSRQGKVVISSAVRIFG